VSRRTAATWLVGLYAVLLNLCYSCPATAQEIGRFDARGEVVVTRIGDTLRVVIPTEYGRITLEVGAVSSPDPDVPGGPIDPVPPDSAPDPAPAPWPTTWDGIADHLLRDVPPEDRSRVAAAVLAGLDAVIQPPAGSAPVTTGQSAAALLLDVASNYDFGGLPPNAPTTILAIVRVGDVLVKAGDDGPLAARYARALRPRILEIANGG
jgi:hypothetical protein